MSNITIPELPLVTTIPLNSLIPFENIQNNETQATTLSTILSNVVPSTKLYINNVLSGTYPALNIIAGSNITLAGSNSSNYYNLTINSTIPNPLSIANVGGGIGLYKNFNTNYNFKTLVAGSNISITPDTDIVTISATNVGETNTVTTVGTGVSLFKQKTGSDLQFKSIVAGSNISIDTSNNNQIVINSTGGSSNATGQNIGIGTGRLYVNNVSSVLRFKTLRAGSNILISDGASEVIISAVTGGEGTTLQNTNDSGSKLINLSNQVKTLVAGDGIIFNDTEASINISTNATNSIANVGAGTNIGKGYNSTLDRYELKSIKGQDGLIVESLNNNEIVISATNLASKYITGQSFGSLIPSNNQVFKVVNNHQWALALPSDSTTPIINFLAFYLSGRLYLSNNFIDGLTGIVAGTIYYLNNDSTYSTTASTVVLGVGINTTTIWFKPYAA